MTMPVPAVTPELSETLKRILRLAHEAIPFDKGAIHLIEGQMLWTRAIYGAPGVVVDPGIEGTAVSLDKGFCGYVAREGVPFLSPVVVEERRLRPTRYKGANLLIQSFLGVPLRLEDAVIGVLEMDSLTAGFFQQSHVELAEAVADQAALAISNSLLLHEAQAQQGMMNRQLAQHRALYEIGAQINAKTDVQQMLAQIMSTVRTLFAADGLSMFMAREVDSSLDFTGALGLSDDYVASEKVHFARAAGGLAIAHRLPLLIADVTSDPRMEVLWEAASKEGLHTGMFLPLVYRDDIVGLMALYHRDAYSYDTEQMELLSIFANQATTAIKNAEFYASVVQSRSNLNAILQSMTDGVVALDMQSRVIFINQALFDLLGISPSADREWIGRASSELWPQLHRIIEEFSRGVTQPPPDGIARLAMQLEDPARTVEIAHSAIVDDTGAHIGRLILLSDVTEQRAAERMKDELISILSHELRTPLTSILGYSKLLVDRPHSSLEKRGRWAAHILEKSRMLNRLVSEVLDLARLNMHRFDLRPAPLNLEALIRRIVGEQRLTTDNHTIRLDIRDDLGAVPVDQDRLDQVLTNLMINAIKYSPDGGTINVRAGADIGEVWLEVQDEGIGIAPEYHERIFEPFFRVDNSTTRDVYGTGLGLSLCRGIIEAHGGTISVESEVGGGTTFRVCLPLFAPDVTLE
jgi:PAS domain S-box-containing protein